ncbi:MAG: YihY/virulence factor BrkB family protein [Candidatus Omnitrophica bacterium]|nr:YihY/virulence factor BrkB family protein [Candidatus Omnitrophota bacterium]
MVGKVHQLIQFLTTDIWRIRRNKLPKQRSFLINQLRIFLLAIRGFNEDECQLRASALTFFSLLSVVPVVAMAFGIAKGFGFEKLLQKQLMERMAGQEEVANRIITFANSFLENTQGGVIAGIGIAVLFWSVIKVLGNIEKSFNDIWGIKKGRSIGRKFSDYLSMMLICPVLLIMSSSVTVLITSQVTLIVEKLSFLGPIGGLILYLLKFLPYCVMWVLFTFMYIFMPNTKVTFKSGLMGGIIAGTIYQLAQWIYITFQVGVSKYGAIYGSFAALPLFLVWLQVSWLIMLFGAEISFAEQNVDTYEFEPDSLKASVSFKRLIALSIAHVCIKKFHQAEEPMTASQMSHELEMPIRLVNQVLFDLTESGVLSEVQLEGGKQVAYQPARDIDQLTICSVLEMINHRGAADIPFAETREINKIKDSLTGISEMINSSPHNLALKDI